jgi:hypothetical protein
MTLKYLMLTLFILLYPDASKAHEEGGHELTEKHEFRVLKEFNVQGGKAIILTHEGGHLMGQPFQVELRAQCDGAASTELVDLPVKDSFSVCDLDPESLKINSRQTALAIKTKVADLKTYYDQVSDGIKEPELKCATKTQIKKFSLNNLCSNN